MMQVLNPTYTLRIEIRDYPQMPQSTLMTVGQVNGPMGVVQVPMHKWYKIQEGTIGCDEVLKDVREAFQKAGINASFIFERFEQK